MENVNLSQLLILENHEFKNLDREISRLLDNPSDVIGAPSLDSFLAGAASFAFGGAVKLTSIVTQALELMGEIPGDYTNPAWVTHFFKCIADVVGEGYMMPGLIKAGLLIAATAILGVASVKVSSYLINLYQTRQVKKELNKLRLAFNDLCRHREVALKVENKSQFVFDGMVQYSADIARLLGSNATHTSETVKKMVGIQWHRGTKAILSLLEGSYFEILKNINACLNDTPINLDGISDEDLKVLCDFRPSFIRRVEASQDQEARDDLILFYNFSNYNSVKVNFRDL